MGSRARLWSVYGEAWGWPATSARSRPTSSFDDAVFDAGETELLGCVYIDPPDGRGTADAVVSWWVVDAAVGSALDAALAELVPAWVRDAFGVRDVRVGL